MRKIILLSLVLFSGSCANHESASVSAEQNAFQEFIHRFHEIKTPLEISCDSIIHLSVTLPLIEFNRWVIDSAVNKDELDEWYAENKTEIDGDWKNILAGVRFGGEKRPKVVLLAYEQISASNGAQWTAWELVYSENGKLISKNHLGLHREYSSNQFEDRDDISFNRSLTQKNLLTFSIDKNNTIITHETEITETAYQESFPRDTSYVIRKEREVK